MNLSEVNEKLAKASPQEIVNWAVSQYSEDIFISTNFRPQEAVLLHMAVQAKKDIPVLWADHGYNTRETYNCAFKLIEMLNLNIKLYVPKTTVGYRDALYGGIPQIEKKELHDKFTEEVKLEPFDRGLQELKPKAWLTALRKDQTEFRQGLDIVSPGKYDMVKVCPVLNWTHEDMEAYLAEHNLPSVKNYFDPTKVLDKRECGLHPNF